MFSSTTRASSAMQTDYHDVPWLIYTDIFQRYQFRYPAGWKITQHNGVVYLQFSQTQERPSTYLPCENCRVIVYKPQAFQKVIDLENVLGWKDRQSGSSSSTHRSAITDLPKGYQGIREVVDQTEEMLHSYLYISYQARMVSIFSVIRQDLEIDMQIARSMRFL